MDFWEKIKKDLQKGIKEGIHAMKEGAAVVREKTGELTEEGKRRYQIFDLQTKVEKEIADLGGRVYDVVRTGAKNPMLDSKVKAIASRIKKLEERITKLEGKPVAEKTVAKRTPRPKKTPAKTRQKPAGAKSSKTVKTG